MARKFICWFLKVAGKCHKESSWNKNKQTKLVRMLTSLKNTPEQDKYKEMYLILDFKRYPSTSHTKLMKKDSPQGQSRKNKDSVGLAMQCFFILPSHLRLWEATFDIWRLGYVSFLSALLAHFASFLPAPNMWRAGVNDRVGALSAGPHRDTPGLVEWVK